MLTLYIVRHAYAEEGDRHTKDFDRHLNGKGMGQAMKAGRKLKERGVKPDLMVSSPASRALTTAELIAERIGYDRDEIIQEEEMYNASFRTLLLLVQKLPDDKHEVMITGHNPGFSYMAEHLSHKETNGLPKAGMVKITFDTDRWALASEDTSAFAWQDLSAAEIPAQ